MLVWNPIATTVMLPNLLYRKYLWVICQGHLFDLQITSKLGKKKKKKKDISSNLLGATVSHCRIFQCYSLFMGLILVL